MKISKDFIGFVSSILGILGFFMFYEPFNKFIKGSPIFFIGLFGLYIIIYIGYKVIPKNRIEGREAVISKGIELVSNTKDEVVMYGKDISWAKEYELCLSNLIKNGKNVTIYYVPIKTKIVIDNVELLSQIGAKLRPLKKDFGLRGTLIDPNGGNDTILYVASRIPKYNMLVKESQTHIHYGKVLNSKYDSSVIRIFSSFHGNYKCVTLGECHEE